jgi:hypothetical protein
MITLGGTSFSFPLLGDSHHTSIKIKIESISNVQLKFISIPKINDSGYYAFKFLKSFKYCTFEDNNVYLPMTKKISELREYPKKSVSIKLHDFQSKKIDFIVGQKVAIGSICIRAFDVTISKCINEVKNKLK